MKDSGKADDKKKSKTTIKPIQISPVLFLTLIVSLFSLGLYVGKTTNEIDRIIKSAEKIRTSDTEKKKQALDILAKQKNLIEIATKNVRIEESRRTIALALATQLIKQRMWNEALKYLKIAEEIQPGDYSVNYELGLTYYNLYKLEKNIDQKSIYEQYAEDHLITAYQSIPSSTDINYLLGLFSLDRGKFRDAYEYLSFCIREDSDNPDYLFALARVYYELERYTDAKKVYMKLEMIVSDNSDKLSRVQQNLKIVNQRILEENSQ